jgi:hypothetical protein
LLYGYIFIITLIKDFEEFEFCGVRGYEAVGNIGAIGLVREGARAGEWLLKKRTGLL